MHEELRYVHLGGRGLARRRAGSSFAYVDAHGRRVRDGATLSRIRRLAIPPAWREVWICPDPRGHIQAVGRDARGRRQYRYHAVWRRKRDETKYHHMLAFGRALPRLRARLARDLRRTWLPREKVVATIVRLLETTLIRVGNREYARAHKHYGLTTMHDSHVDIRGAHLRFHFRGKSGKRHEIELDDPRLARAVRQCRDVPGYELFQYVDEAGRRQVVGASDVNDYIRAATANGAGEIFTAKDFRTFAGTVLAADALRDFDDGASPAARKRGLARAVEAVAARLGNTATVCRKCYIHPEIMAAYLEGELVPRTRRRARGRASGLSAAEAAVLAFLRRRSSAPSPSRRTPGFVDRRSVC